MNERIKELAEQAGGHYLPPNMKLNKPEHIFLEDEQVKKFVELIVKECCDWIDGSPTSESGCQLLLTKQFIIANLKGHFGV